MLISNSKLCVFVVLTITIIEVCSACLFVCVLKCNSIIILIEFVCFLLFPKTVRRYLPLESEISLFVSSELLSLTVIESFQLLLIVSCPLA